MKVQRITNPIDLLQWWEFFVEGFNHIEDRTGYPMPMAESFKAMCILVSHPTLGYVSLALNENNQPQGFAAAQDATPLFERERVFSGVSIYHKPGNNNATEALQEDFENYCREQGVARYVVTTRRTSGAASKCFAKYGLHKKAISFEKEIK